MNERKTVENPFKEKLKHYLKILGILAAGILGINLIR